MSAPAGGQAVLGLLLGTERMLDQGFRFRPPWWTSRVDDPSVSGWLDALPADPGGRGYHRITRGQMLSVADGTDGWEVRALLAAYVWGTGSSAFLVPRRARTFRDTPLPALHERLTTAVAVLRADGTEAAYRALSRGRPAAIKHLGPAFFTKLLYVADGAQVDRPGGALIMDRFVVQALNKLHGWSEPPSGWTAARYSAWLDVATEQAELAARELGRAVRRDEIEHAYFTYGTTL